MMHGIKSEHHAWTGYVILHLSPCMSTYVSHGCFVLRMQGIPFTFHSRLQDWDIRAHALVLKCSTELVPWKTLRTALRQIDALHAPDSIIQLPEWSWTPAMLNVVATELPHLRFSVNITGGLTDELLGALHRCGPAVPQLVVDFLVLSSDEHCNAAWHWDDLTVHDRADVGQLLKLGDPRGRVSPPIVNIPRGVRIDSASVNEVSRPLTRSTCAAAIDACNGSWHQWSVLLTFAAM